MIRGVAGARYRAVMAAAPTLLTTLSEQAVDDNCSLASVLRSCMLLGAHTRSELLQDWAHRELNGYDTDAEVPSYRRRPLPLLRDRMIGQLVIRRELFHRLELPDDLREGVPEEVVFFQPIDELEAMANAPKPPPIGMDSFPLVARLWTHQLMGQSIQKIYYQPGTEVFAAMIGAVRTQLVEIVAVLLRDAPDDELPSKGQVDNVVTQRVYHVAGDLNEISVGSNTGAVGAGRKSTQTVYASAAATELADQLNAIRALIEQLNNDDDRADLHEAVNDVEAEAVAADPNEGRMRSRARALRRLAQSVGASALTAAATDLTTTALSAAGLS